MPEWSVPRLCHRHPIRIPFLHKPRTDAPTRAGVGWTRNLGEGGACVELDWPLRPQMPLCEFPPLLSGRNWAGSPPDTTRMRS